MRKLGTLFIVLLFAVCALQAEENASVEESLHQSAAAAQKALPNLPRFELLRFYPPRNTVYEDPTFWDHLFTSYTSSKERALAFYLFNMYASERVYKEKKPFRLTLNFLGALDAFSMQDEPLDPADALEFYQDHQAQIQKHLTVFFKEAHFGTYTPNANFETAALRVLQAAPKFHKRAGYFKPKQNLLRGTISAQDKSLLEPAWAQAKAYSTLKIVKFENVRTALPENFDNKYARSSESGSKNFYRWVKDECNYSSYLTGKFITQAYRKSPRGWGALRLYMLTARAQKGGYLHPAQGKRFRLADEKWADKWQYHTAILAVMNTAPHVYTPVVLDSFLGGEKLLTLDQWLSFFAQDTVFFAGPFKRSQAVENAIVEPDAVEFNDEVWVGDKKYVPAPIEK